MFICLGGSDFINLSLHVHVCGNLFLLAIRSGLGEHSLGLRSLPTDTELLGLLPLLRLLNGPFMCH